MSADSEAAQAETASPTDFSKFVRFNGVSPQELFTERLTEVGSETWGPDHAGEFTSNCPAHPDQRASLRWTVSSSGVVKFHCLAGCDYGEILKSLKMRGFDLRWASVDYAYWDLDTRTGEMVYLFDVRRYNKADAAGKQYVQFRREALPEDSPLGSGFTEVPGNGLEGRDNGPLWLWPGLLERAEDARAAGQALEVVLCHSDDTEILTDRGWVLFPELLDSDRVAQVDRETKQVSFVRPEAVQRLPYSGKMLNFKNKHQDALVTPDHRMWTLTQGQKKTEVIRPASEMGTHSKAPVSVLSRGGKEFDPDVARLMVAWQADGVNEQRGDLVHFQFAKQRKTDRMHSLLNRLGIAFQTKTVYPESHQSSGRLPQIWTVIRRDSHPVFSRRDSKSFSMEIVDWDLEARTAFLEELAFWDGDGNGDEGTHWRYFTGDRINADVVQAVAAISGVGCLITEYDRSSQEGRENASIEYRLNLSRHTTWRRLLAAGSNKPEEVEYSGTVYCVTVPDDTILTRRNGRVLWSGNCEGEKDAHAIWLSGAVGRWDFVTTSAGGAGGWRERHTADLLALAEAGMLAKVVVICDPDKAGKARGPAIISALEEAFAPLEAAGKTIPVHAVTTDGIDVADLADREGTKFWSHLVGMDAVEMASAMEEGSVISGYVTRVGMPGVPGRKAMAMPKNDDEYTIILSGEIRPVAMWDTGWQVDVVGPAGSPRRTMIEKTDLSTKQHFDRWLIQNNLAVPPNCRVGVSAITQGLGVWLNWYCDMDPSVKKMKSTPYLTWVDPGGNPSKEPGKPGSKAEAVWISGDPVADAERGFVWTGSDLLGRWDHQHTELDAAWAWTQALTFGDERTVAAVAGWAASVLVAPWLARWSDTKPGLAIIAVSSSGKTHGASRMLLQLAGCRGNFTGSVAAIRRQFSAGGISTIRWIDDASDGLLENSTFKEILRITTSQSEHSLSTPDDGTTATHSSKMTGSVVVSAEGVSWMKETAMLDRFLLVQPDKPTGRTSLRADRAGERQWYDVLDLQEVWGKDWACMAGWSVDGLRAAIGPGGEILAEIVKEVGRPGDRGDIGAWYAAVGARLLRLWLGRVRDEAREGVGRPSEALGMDGRAVWPGDDSEWLGGAEEGLEEYRERVRDWDWLVGWADERLEQERIESKNRYGSLVTQVLPLLFTRAHATESSKWKTPLYLTVPCGCEGDQRRTKDGGKMPQGWVENGEAIRASLRAMTEADATGISVGLPPVLVEECGAVWVDTRSLAAWYQTDPIGRKGEERVVGAQALMDQAKAVADTPSWAKWSKHVGKDRHGNSRPPVTRNELKIYVSGRGDSGAVRYVRLTHEASEAAREGH